MGFLDRMVADLIADSTGLPVRRVVRRVGAKKLLMLGGAAVAGGLAMQKMSQSRSGAGAGAPPPAAPGHGAPPPPPPPGPAGNSAIPPPPPPPPVAPESGLPPVPGSATPTADAADEPAVDPDLSYAIVRTMVAAALADGELADEERRLVHDHLGESELGDERTAQVRKDLVLPPSPAELAGLVAGPEHAKVLYRSALLVLLADAEVSDLESAWLERLGGALGLDQPTQAMLRADLEAIA